MAGCGRAGPTAWHISRRAPAAAGLYGAAEADRKLVADEPAATAGENVGRASGVAIDPWQENLAKKCQREVSVQPAGKQAFPRLRRPGEGQIGRV
jgi:hypothetical protein